MGGPGPTVTPSKDTLVYTVQSGDTISGIAQRFGSQIDWILQANKLKGTEFLRIGQPLTVPRMPATPIPTPTARSYPGDAFANACARPEGAGPADTGRWCSVDRSG